MGIFRTSISQRKPQVIRARLPRWPRAWNKSRARVRERTRRRYLWAFDRDLWRSAIRALRAFLALARAFFALDFFARPFAEDLRGFAAAAFFGFGVRLSGAALAVAASPVLGRGLASAAIQ